MLSSRARAVGSSGPDPKNPLGVERGDTVTYRKAHKGSEEEITFVVSSMGGGSDSMDLKAFNSEKQKEEFKCDAKKVVRVESKGAGSATVAASAVEVAVAAPARSEGAPAATAVIVVAAPTATGATTATVATAKPKAKKQRQAKEDDDDDSDYVEDTHVGDDKGKKTHNTNTRTDLPKADDGVRPPLTAANVNFTQGNEGALTDFSSPAAVSSGAVVDTSAVDTTATLAMAAKPVPVAKSSENHARMGKTQTYLMMNKVPQKGDQVLSRYRAQRKGKIFKALVESVEENTGKVVLAYYRKGTDELDGDKDTVTLKYVWPWLESAGESIVADGDDGKTTYRGDDLDDGGIPVLFTVSLPAPANVDPWTVFAEKNPSCMLAEVSIMASSTLTTGTVFKSSTPPSSSLPRVPLETRNVTIHGAKFMAIMESDGSKRFFTVLDTSDYLEAWAEGRIADSVPTVSAAASAKTTPITDLFAGLVDLVSATNVSAAMEGKEPRSVTIKVGGSEQILFLALGGRAGLSATRPTLKTPLYYVTAETVDSPQRFGYNCVDALSVQKGAARETAFSMCLANFKETVDSNPIEVIVLSYLYALVSGQKDFVQVLYVVADSESSTPLRALASATSTNSVAAIFEHFEFRPEAPLTRTIGDLVELRELFLHKLTYDASFGLSRQHPPFVSNARDAAIVDFASLGKAKTDTAKLLRQSGELAFWTKKGTSDSRQLGSRETTPSLSQQKAATASSATAVATRTASTRKGRKDETSTDTATSSSTFSATQLGQIKKAASEAASLAIASVKGDLSASASAIAKFQTKAAPLSDHDVDRVAAAVKNGTIKVVQSELAAMKAQLGGAAVGGTQPSADKRSVVDMDILDAVRADAEKSASRFYDFAMGSRDALVETNKHAMSQLSQMGAEMSKNYASSSSSSSSSSSTSAPPLSLDEGLLVVRAMKRKHPASDSSDAVEGDISVEEALAVAQALKRLNK